LLLWVWRQNSGKRDQKKARQKKDPSTNKKTGERKFVVRGGRGKRGRASSKEKDVPPEKKKECQILKKRKERRLWGGGRGGQTGGGERLACYLQKWKKMINGKGRGQGDTKKNHDLCMNVLTHGKRKKT